MSTAYDAWIIEKRPIYSRLPEFLTNEVEDWVTYYWDELLVSLLEKLKDVERQIDPLRCDPEWLDFLAPLFGFTSEYWDSNWSTESKRLLLANAYNNISIWERKGTADVLSFVLSALGIRNEVVQNGSFLIGIDTVGEPLGLIAWDYTLYLDPIYEGTDTEKLALKINRLFGACYCVSRIVYDSERFVTIDLLTSETQDVITTEDDEALRVDKRIYGM